jgi:hypothetical protein
VREYTVCACVRRADPLCIGRAYRVVRYLGNMCVWRKGSLFDHSGTRTGIYQSQKRFYSSLEGICLHLLTAVARTTKCAAPQQYSRFLGSCGHSCDARCHQFVTRIPKASASSLPPWLLRLLPAGAVAGWDLHPLESAALSRRKPEAVIKSGSALTVLARTSLMHEDARWLCRFTGWHSRARSSIPLPSSPRELQHFLARRRPDHACAWSSVGA